MNKIKFKTKSFSINIESDSDIKELFNITSGLIDNYINNSDISDIKDNNIVEFKNINNTKTEEKKHIPGEVNLNELSIQEAETKHLLFRCPCCGQGHVCLVKPKENEYILMARHNNDFEYIETLDEDGADKVTITNMLSVKNINITEDYIADFDKEENKDKLIDYFDDIQSFEYNSDCDVIIEDDTNIMCPICSAISPASSWINAYNNPLEYFEYDDICDVCGGEMIYSVSKKDQENELECEICKLKKVFK